MSEMVKKHAPPTFRWPWDFFLGPVGVGTPQKKWARHFWVGGSLREKIIHFILAPSETYLLARFDPLAVTILETLAVITSAGYAPRANLVIQNTSKIVFVEKPNTTSKKVVIREQEDHRTAVVENSRFYALKLQTAFSQALDWGFWQLNEACRKSLNEFSTTAEPTKQQERLN